MKLYTFIAAAAGSLLCLSTTLNAQTEVGTAAELQAAINNGETNIVLTGNIAVTAPIYIGTTNSPTVAINGAGHSLTGTSEIFFVQSGNVSISNATLSGNAVGGNGGNGQQTGGGAAGLGGAIFVGSTANVTASGIQFTNNSATGGNGGTITNNGFGGGGGLNGGNGGNGMSGGGGGGGNGGIGGLGTGASGGGGLQSPGNNSTGLSGGNGGGPNGGTGGAFIIPAGSATGPNSGGGGTGGIFSTGPAGNGSANGGGGGGSTGGSGNGGAYGGGGGGLVAGGTGGFGGGGGGSFTQGGNGGFGGGGGAGGLNQIAGAGGVGAGNGAHGDPSFSAGGGGAGFGGAVFVQSGGTFTVTGNETFFGNTVAGGTGGNPGAAAGGDLFAMTGAITTLAPGTGSTQTFNGSIADDSISSVPGGQAYTAGNGAGAAITIGSVGSQGGTVFFNDANSYSGGTSITNGAALVVGNSNALSNGPVLVDGGTLAAGLGNHVINVSTSYTQTDTGNLLLAINGVGATAVADHLVAAPATTVSLNGQLTVNLAGFALPAGRRHPITYSFVLVSSDDADTGEFANFDVLDSPRGLKATLDYTPAEVVLDLNVLTFSTYGLTANEQGVLTSINRGLINGSTSPSLARITAALIPLNDSVTTLGPALDQLSPLKFNNFASVTAFNNASFETQNMDSYLAGLRMGAHGTFMGSNGGIDSSGLTVNDPNVDPSLAMVHSRLLAWNAPAGLADMGSSVLGGIDMKDMKEMHAPATESNPWNVFVRGNVILAQGFSQADIAHFDDNSESVVIGADYRLTPNFLVGLTAGYSHTDATLDTFNSSATIDSYSPGVYASYAKDGWYANVIGRYSYNSYTNERHIDFLHQTANSATDGNEGVADLDGGYDFHSGALTYGPTVGLQYTHLTVNSYGESGSAANLGVNEDQSDSLRSRVGGTVRYAFKSAGMTLTPHFSASWEHEFMDQARGITSQFSNFAGGDFTVRTPDSSDDFALVDAGLDAQINKSITVFGDYLIQAGQDNYFGQSVQAGVKVNF